jgi:hypothetical protein
MAKGLAERKPGLEKVTKKKYVCPEVQKKFQI